jgi:hypothetical protein
MKRKAGVLKMNITDQRNRAVSFLRSKAKETGVVPVCAWCKRIPHGPGGWIRFEEYFSNVRGIHFSHGICPNCSENVLFVAGVRGDKTQRADQSGPFGAC